MALQMFFLDLGKKVPAFSQFRNTTLFKNIMAYKFKPDTGYASYHRCISLLAISLHSFAAQECKSQDDDHFE